MYGLGHRELQFICGSHTHSHVHTGFTGGSVVKNPPAMQEPQETSSIPGLLGRSLAEGLGNPLQYSCLETPMDRGAWWVTVRGVAKTQRQLQGFSTQAYAGMRTHTHTQSGSTSQKFTFKKEAGIIHHDTNTFIDSTLVY